MVKTSFNLNATAGVTGRSEKAFLSHIVIGQYHSIQRLSPFHQTVITCTVWSRD